MCECRFKVSGIEMLCKGEEGLRMTLKVGNVEDCFCIWKVACCKIAIETCPWGAEV